MAWQVEVLAKTVLDAPIEIQVGGRSVVNADITQARRGSRVVQRGSRGVHEQSLILSICSFVCCSVSLLRQAGLLSAIGVKGIDVGGIRVMPPPTQC